jgi:preprotein translocase subunit YajC
MDFLISSAWAQAAAPADAPSPFGPIWLMPVLILVFYFIMIRPQMKRDKEQRALLAALEKGDEVLTHAGIYGRIETVGETVLTIAIADGVSIKVSKRAISSVLPKGTLKSL